MQKNLSHSLRMIEEDIEKHVEPKVEKDESIDIHRMHTEYETLSRPTRIWDSGKATGWDEERKDFSHESEWIMDDIPRVPPEESPDIDTEERDEHSSRDEYPCPHCMIAMIPVGMHELDRGESWDESCECCSRYEDYIVVDICRKSIEVDEVCEDIERIR